MIIDGIEYCVWLGTIGEDGFEEYEFHFEDFYALNAFIREHANDPKYLDKQMCYSLVEIIDGEPDSHSWVQRFPWREFSDDQIQTEIENLIEDMKEWAELSAKVDEFDKEIHYRESTVDYRKKQHHLEDLAYVCPTCIRDIEDCRCAGYPYYLVQIDKLMVPIIRELNSKGYETTGCCAGHLEQDEFPISGIYISFAEDYDFGEPFPAGGRYSKVKHLIQYLPPEGCENLAEFQRDTLWKLEDWAEMLFERKCDEMFEDVDSDDTV